MKHKQSRLVLQFQVTVGVGTEETDWNADDAHRTEMILKDKST